MSTLTPVHLMTDRLLNTAFSQAEIPATAREEEHERTRRLIGAMLLDDWETEQRTAAHALRAAVGFACAPSTECVVRSKTHDRTVARAVGQNISDLSAYILDSKDFCREATYKRDDLGHIIGFVAEVAVLGALWKGVADGYRDEKQYILLSTQEQDSSKIVNGTYTGFDLVIRQSGTRQKNGYIQVKNRPGYSPVSKRKKIYRPGIAIMTPAMLLEDETAIGYTLLEAVASNDSLALERANQNADIILAQITRLSTTTTSRINPR